MKWVKSGRWKSAPMWVHLENKGEGTGLCHKGINSMHYSLGNVIKDKGTKDEEGRNQGSSQSNKSLLEWALASGKTGTWGCTISVNYPNNTMRHQSTDFSSETKSMPGGSKTVKRKWCCFHICLIELLGFPCTGKYQAVFKSRD